MEKAVSPQLAHRALNLLQPNQSIPHSNTLLSDSSKPPNLLPRKTHLAYAPQAAVIHLESASRLPRQSVALEAAECLISTSESVAPLASWRAAGLSILHVEARETLVSVFARWVLTYACAERFEIGLAIYLAMGVTRSGIVLSCGILDLDCARMAFSHSLACIWIESVEISSVV